MATIDVLGGAALARRSRQAGRRPATDVVLVDRATPLREAAEVVLLAVPASVVVEVVTARAEQLAGRLLIDATNDVSGGIPNLAGAIQAAAPGARVVKAFNTVFATFFESPVGPEVADLAYCADEVPRELVEQLIADAGFRPVDAGPLSAASDLEGLARLVIRTAMVVGRGPFTYRFSTRDELAG